MDIGMCRFLSQDWIRYATRLGDEKPNGVHDSLEVSLLNHVEHLSSSVERLWFVQGRRGFGPAILVTTINTGVRLQASLAAFPDAVSRQQLHEIAQCWKQELLALTMQ